SEYPLLHGLRLHLRDQRDPAGQPGGPGRESDAGSIPPGIWHGRGHGPPGPAVRLQRLVGDRLFLGLEPEVLTGIAPVDARDRAGWVVSTTCHARRRFSRSE